MLTNLKYNICMFIGASKEFINIVAFLVGVVTTFFGDFPLYSYNILRSNIATTFFIEITTETLTKADLILSMFMRVAVGVGTLLIARYFAKKKNKK